mmetsp:Transcript_10282/g.17264  ORF Transcript_10282/g.17264 Transcript_10282/m.17264 type:complete len:99 (+) Transcript_10282:828-1124(+)
MLMIELAQNAKSTVTSTVTPGCTIRISLTFACTHNQVESAQLLLESDAILTSSDSQLKNSFNLSCMWAHYEPVLQLLDAGAPYPVTWQHISVAAGGHP